MPETPEIQKTAGRASDRWIIRSKAPTPSRISTAPVTANPASRGGLACMIGPGTLLSPLDLDQVGGRCCFSRKWTQRSQASTRILSLAPVHADGDRRPGKLGLLATW
jgi:hypothetical protein